MDIYGKPLANSPFLNQTVSKIREFTIIDRLNENKSDQVEFVPPKSSFSWKEKISTRAKEDIELTLQQAVKVTSASQEIVDRLTNGSNSQNTNSENGNSASEERENFGFKTKKDAEKIF